MNIPGFNAEASMYRTSNTYQAAHGTLTGSPAVIPQQCRLVCNWVCTPPLRCFGTQKCCGSVNPTGRATDNAGQKTGPARKRHKRRDLGGFFGPLRRAAIARCVRGRCPPSCGPCTPGPCNPDYSRQPSTRTCRNTNTGSAFTEPC